MAYQQKNLSALSYANGFTLWHYKTSDIPGDVDTSGYFNTAVKMLRVGDFVLVNAGIGGTPKNGVMVVVDNNGSVVDVANLVDFGPTDSD